jgi:hypothetical protein
MCLCNLSMSGVLSDVKFESGKGKEDNMNTRLRTVHSRYRYSSTRYQRAWVGEPSVTWEQR